MEQRTIDDNRMHILNNQLYYKPLRAFEDGLMIAEDVEGKYVLKVAVHETRLQNESWLDVWYKDSEVTQHVHTGATETFYIIDGDAELITPGGVRTVLREGDIFHCPAGMGHEFHTLGETMSWFNLFTQLHYWNIIQTEIDMSQHNPDKMRDVPYYRSFISSMNSEKLPPYPPVQTEDTPYWVRRKGQSLLQYQALGVKLGLKVAPWETMEKNEVWEVELKKGTRVTASEPFNFWQTYIVEDGEMRCTVGTNSFAAKRNDFIHIYPHKPFDMMCESDVRLLSWGSGYKLLSALEAAVYEKRENPAAFADAARQKQFMLEHGIPAFEITQG